MATQAEQIAARYGDDGSTMRDADGIGIVDTLESCGAARTRYDRREVSRYVLPAEAMRLTRWASQKSR